MQATVALKAPAARALPRAAAPAAAASGVPAPRCAPAPAALKPLRLRIATSKQLGGAARLSLGQVGPRTCAPVARGSCASCVVAMAQCQATTQKGHQCSRSAGADGYCWQHTGKTYDDKPRSAPRQQCQAPTKKGTQCTRSAGADGYCWQHS